MISSRPWIAECVTPRGGLTPLRDIAPLLQAGLVAPADILAAKDIDKAITDHAERRADERRWCREGKLFQPGWWKAEVAVECR